jgi:hypothetical protein
MTKLLNLWFGEKKTWGISDDGARRDQFKLVYDYIRLHLQLYLATPPIFTIVATGLDRPKDKIEHALIALILIYLIAGIDAAWRMSKCLNEPWQAGYIAKLEAQAFSRVRRFMNHSCYWIGLIAAGIIVYV